ncbi:2618_t:CDS:2, partial [Funneliformis mosseae]
NEVIPAVDITNFRNAYVIQTINRVVLERHEFVIDNVDLNGHVLNPSVSIAIDFEKWPLAFKQC